MTRRRVGAVTVLLIAFVIALVYGWSRPVAVFAFIGSRDPVAREPMDPDLLTLHVGPMEMLVYSFEAQYVDLLSRAEIELSSLGFDRRKFGSGASNDVAWFQRTAPTIIGPAPVEEWVFISSDTRCESKRVTHAKGWVTVKVCRPRDMTRPTFVSRLRDLLRSLLP